jgi:hypothetical protein
MDGSEIDTSRADIDPHAALFIIADFASGQAKFIDKARLIIILK